MVDILTVEPREDYTLFLTFSDGKKGLFDVKPYLEEGSVFKELKNVALFKSVRVSDISIEWANGADLCPDCIYLETSFKESA